MFTGTKTSTMSQWTTEAIRAWDDPTQVVSSRALQLNLCSVFVRLGSVDFIAPYFQAWKKGTKKNGFWFWYPGCWKKVSGDFLKTFISEFQTGGHFFGNPQLCLCFLLALFFTSKMKPAMVLPSQLFTYNTFMGPFIEKTEKALRINFLIRIFFTENLQSKNSDLHQCH